jgi:hypothetical protein
MIIFIYFGIWQGQCDVDSFARVPKRVIIFDYVFNEVFEFILVHIKFGVEFKYLFFRILSFNKRKIIKTKKTKTK